MTEVTRKVKLVTQQAVLADLPPAQQGFPMREWSIRLYLLGPNGEEHPASVFDKVTYKLHPTFTNPTRVIRKPPFTLQERGWGEFDMELVLHAIDKGGDHHIKHDLNFQKSKYESSHIVTFVNPRPNLLKQLALSGPNGTGKRAGRRHEGEERAKKKTRNEKAFDMEKLADALQRLGEDDLLKVVQMVHDHKTTETYVKNDTELGEFHVDLYTLPEHLIKMLWRFVQDCGALGV
ncbi:yeats family-domain-containing protein [Sphaerosporella brunnea]|uniref:Yeats family-domain-containing protein n=1 Tax=Sphaerosporella brunnea TaxID=1250544 RepID=A0A5J5F806_9PEZI|nr:yeats family-domain-containing protein [Sphaerosporella brunnea]